LLKPNDDPSRFHETELRKTTHRGDKLSRLRITVRIDQMSLFLWNQGFDERRTPGAHFADATGTRFHNQIQI